MSKIEKPELTEMKCPECGGDVYKSFHRFDDYQTQSWDYRWFKCFGMCNLSCGNCNKVDSHGDCCAEFCNNKSSWEPRKKQ